MTNVAAGAGGGGRPVRVVIAGGGTGGHLYPGLAVAAAIVGRMPAATVSFAGTAQGIESRVVPRAGFALDLIRSAGLKGKSIGALIDGLRLLPLGAIDAWRLLSRRSPDLVIGVGGYSSGPVVALAALRGIPTMVLEQNAVPGLTNRLLARVVGAAAVSYDTTRPYFGAAAFVSGNPVRPEFFARAAQPARTGADPTRVLVFGGSQGARAINSAVIDALPALAGMKEQLAVTHQTGERDLERVREAYRRALPDGRVEPFLFDMPRDMHAADLVVCRAGATTLAELAAAGEPAILIPFPHATDDHQRRNAEVFEAAGAAVVLDESDLTGDRLGREIAALAGDPERRRAMADRVRTFARPGAADAIADRAMALARGERGEVPR